MFDIESYHKADSVDKAISLLSQNPNAIPIAGGTDVLVRLRQGNPDYGHIVDIHDVADLKKIMIEADGTIVVGSGATFTDLITSPIITENIPVLAQGAGAVGGPQVRNQATVGGNICNGAPSADSAAPLLVLNAMVELKGPQGLRRIPLHEFYQGPGRVDREQAEIMTALRIAPDDFQCWVSSYQKYAMRDAMDIATIGCALACLPQGKQLDKLRLAFTVAGPTPLRCWKTEEKARGAALDQSLVQLVGESVLGDLRPRDSWRAPKDLRQQIIKTLAQRVLIQVLQQLGVSLT
jgi:xanthine dehydrogenase FAD-binding subunit